ncbi:hypothetical protein NQ314_000332 [Rhamnusium bicolor]|uniref:TLC domain-containing protein n=1 Tax=Rhamnusium bicolor TaxID=1586634 RepID=A0AAV8ZWV5_9CUCU|nr:hypothetical protein NQ314_000332 [Rhamnusium bicolor]
MRQKAHLTTHNFFKKEQKKAGSIIPLLLLAFFSVVVSILTVNNLEWESRISIKRGLILFFSGLVFFPSLYLAMNCIFLHTNSGRKIVKTYKLSYSDVFDISNKQVSAVQALFGCITGLTSVCYSCSRNILKTSHYITEAYAWFGAAYFFYDIWSMYKHLRGGLGDCFFGFVYLMEASTPFVSLRGILSKIGMKNSSIYVINGLVMLAVFFLCRIAMFPYVMYMYAQTIKMDFISAVYTLPRSCLISIAILLLPQMYWFLLMVNGATKVLKKSVSNNNNLKNMRSK